MQPPASPGRQSAATHAAILRAFTALALERRYEAIRVGDIIRAANIGRSTFYEHFTGKDAVMLEATAPILLALATAASGRAARSYVRNMVAHLWDRRALIRPLLDSEAAGAIRRSLSEAILPHALRAGHAEGDAHIAATGAAAAQLAMLRCWLIGEAPSNIDAMTERMLACSRLVARKA
ncbi:TetR/AcrR family transcriptional regulator [Sphingosinithalassobacter portus]|uniref:TetR/AcrR family transcriptional regulator n=1 Tax=Stakelama portus TaxID=2676234 RepID=UPI00137B3287|nr:helix-turn-helix domain-containing protein [Sphingosinithalassobacter portus]